MATIRRAELAEDKTIMTAANDLAIRRALENAGIEFLDQKAGGRRSIKRRRAERRLRPRTFGPTANRGQN
jgi:hypothetical protein